VAVAVAGVESPFFGSLSEDGGSVHHQQPIVTTNRDGIGPSTGNGFARRLDRRVFTEINDRIAELANRNATGVRLFLCECSDRACTEAVEITTAEYARVRADGYFVVYPGHDRAEVGEVVARNSRFIVVSGWESEPVRPSTSGGPGDV